MSNIGGSSAGNLALAKDVKKIKERQNISSLGGAYALTLNEEYICPCDGYFVVSCGYEAGKVALGIVNDINFIRLSSGASTVMKGYQAVPIYVKKGMRIKARDGSGLFYPIQ